MRAKYEWKLVSCVNCPTEESLAVKIPCPRQRGIWVSLASQQDISATAINSIHPTHRSVVSWSQGFWSSRQGQTVGRGHCNSWILSRRSPWISQSIWANFYDRSAWEKIKQCKYCSNFHHRMLSNIPIPWLNNSLSTLKWESRKTDNKNT